MYKTIGEVYKEYTESVNATGLSDDTKRAIKDRIFSTMYTSLTERACNPRSRISLSFTWDNVIESAREQGLEEGKAEGIRQVAKSLLSQGMPLETISKATGLSQNEISKLL